MKSVGCLFQVKIKSSLKFVLWDRKIHKWNSDNDWYFLLPLTWTWVLFSVRYTCHLLSMTAGFTLSPTFKYNDAAFFWEIPCYLMTKLLEVRSLSYLWFVLFRILWIFDYIVIVQKTIWWNALVIHDLLIALSK